MERCAEGEVCIYALVDGSRGAVRYIGQSIDPDTREGAHQRDPERRNLILHELERVPAAIAYRREQYWINYYLRRGAPLLNIKGVPVAEQLKIRQYDRYVGLPASAGRSLEAVATSAHITPEDVVRWLIESFLECGSPALPAPEKTSLSATPPKVNREWFVPEVDVSSLVWARARQTLSCSVCCGYTIGRSRYGTPVCFRCLKMMVENNTEHLLDPLADEDCYSAEELFDYDAPKEMTELDL